MNKPTVLSFGHSNRPIGEFIGKLKDNGIAIIVDVRTKPYSKYCPHFSKYALQRALEAKGISYLFRGNNLGGLGENVDYDKTINEVVQLAETARVCILCSEKDPTACHRHTLLEPSFNKAGAELEHILWD